MSLVRFPAEFVWGAATSAHQIEGSPLADGAGPDIWYRFERQPGTIADGTTADVACDHYRRFAEDVALMQWLGLRAYRFSVAWSRVLPEGTGRVNRAGLAFYDRLVDALLAAGIRPCVTLYHWDLPAALADRGGWANREIVHWFAEYAGAVFDALADRVPLWTTLNEPWVVTDAGYLHGVHAPGHRDLFETPRAAHHLLLAHAAAVEVYRTKHRQKIGIVVNLEPKDPVTDRDEDVAAAHRADAYMNRQYLDPLFLGHYPEELAEMYGDAWPAFPAADLERIRQPVDFLGVNYYTRAVVRHDASALLTRASSVTQWRSTRTEMSWEVHPESLTKLLLRVRDLYGSIPLYVTENGAAFYDPPSPRGATVDDPLRVDYYRTHLRAAHAALAAGVDLRGYFAWSLLDNFEWGLGFTRRFGLVHVDFATQKRTPKASAHFYRDVIRTAGETLGDA